MSSIPEKEKIKQTVAEWKDKPHEDQFAFCETISEKIREIDKQSKTQSIDLSHRNTLVAIVGELHAKLPFRFSVHDKVIITFGRHIKGVVKELVDPSMRSILVRPLDTVYKEEMIVCESLLLRDVAPEIKEGQLTLF